MNTAYLQNPPRTELLEEDFDEANDYDPNAVKNMFKNSIFYFIEHIYSH